MVVRGKSPEFSDPCKKLISHHIVCSAQQLGHEKPGRGLGPSVAAVNSLLAVRPHLA
jgi:hypothetical protein